MTRRHRRYYPHPYARMGCFGPSVGCAGCLIVLAAPALIVVALVIAAVAG